MKEIVNHNWNLNPLGAWVCNKSVFMGQCVEFENCGEIHGGETFYGKGHVGQNKPLPRKVTMLNLQVYF